METVLQFTKNIEETLNLQLKNIVETMKQTHLEEAYKGVEEMYDIPPVEGVKYDRCVMIPGPQNSFYCAPFKLPHDEYVIFKKEQHHRFNNQDCNCCVAITNYGRILHTFPVWPSQFGGMTHFSPVSDTTVANATHGQVPSGHAPITICEPLPYKLPKFAFLMRGLYGVQPGCDDPYNFSKFSDDHRKLDLVTKTVQEYCKEFYMLIGKWQPYIEKNINIDFDKLRENFETQKKNTTQLEIEVKTLLNENNNLKEELDNVKSLYAKLKEDQKDYAELVEWKTTLITHLDDHLDYGCPRKKDGTYLTPNEIGKKLQYYSTIPNNEWEEACEAMDQVKEFKQYQEMQKKFGQFGTTIQNTAIAVKKTKK